jgi:hypothetical protein
LLCMHFVSCSNFMHIYSVGGKIGVDIVVKAHPPYKIYYYLKTFDQGECNNCYSITRIVITSDRKY